MYIRLLAVIVAILSMAACGGGAELGESCDTSGNADECVDGAICTKDSDAIIVCRKECKEQEDCASSEDCNGVSDSSQKSCQPKD